MSQGVGNKLELAIGRNDGDATYVEWLSSGNNFKSVILLASGQAELVLKPKPTPVAEVIDSIIRVDRTAKLVYPDWAKEVLHPELENTGPSEYDGTKLEQFLLPEQKTGTVIGNQIHKHLESNNMLPSCLGLHDLNAIQQKGIAFFRQNFKGKAVFGWRSVVRHRGDNLYVPCLCEGGGEVVLYWLWLDDRWNSSHPALCFAS